MSSLSSSFCPGGWKWQVTADLTAPAGCTGSSQQGLAEANRSAWTLSPPDPAPMGWLRSAQTAPAAGRGGEIEKKVSAA